MIKETSRFLLQLRPIQLFIFPLFLLILLSVLVTGCASTEPPEPDEGIYLGSIWVSGAEHQDFSRYWDQITPETAGFWNSVEGTRNDMDWSELDKAYQYAQNSGIQFLFHSLLGGDIPEWALNLTPQDRGREIDEWMEAVSERYYNSRMINVVDEPLHIAGGYIDAMGGYGETGWDWIINTFQLAREYFPESALIVSEGGILTSSSEFRNYLPLIRLLQSRELLDGIGIQAHSLEDVPLVSIQSSLDILEETGLPVYITGFECDISDDIEQVLKFSELFALFYEHPAVKGITLWGYREGMMSRVTGYLEKSDGSHRYSFQWLLAYLRGEDFVIPEPESVPEPLGNRVEMEDYEEAAGIVPRGDYIGEIEDGDWVYFDSVDFSTDENELVIRYAKGNSAPGKMVIKVGHIGGDTVQAVYLPGTGGWDSFDSISVPWDALDGPHELFLLFQGRSEIANVDYLEFRYTPGEPVSGGNNAENDTPAADW